MVIFIRASKNFFASNNKNCA